MAVSLTINWSIQVEEFKLFCHPPWMPDYVAADALAQSVVGKDIFKTLETAGVMPPGWVKYGYW